MKDLFSDMMIVESEKGKSTDNGRNNDAISATETESIPKPSISKSRV